MWELGLFGEMADLGAGAGYIQDEPQASCSSRKYESPQWPHSDGVCQKDRGQLKEVPMAKDELIWAKK